MMYSLLKNTVAILSLLSVWDMDPVAANGKKRNMKFNY